MLRISYVNCFFFFLSIPPPPSFKMFLFSHLLRSYSVLSLYLLPASFLYCLLSTSLFHFPPSFLLFILLSFFLVCFSPCLFPSLYFPWLISVVQFCILVLLNLQPILPLSCNFIKAQTATPTFSSSTLPSPFSPVCPSFLPSCLPFPTSVCLPLDSFQQPEP